LDLLLDRRHDGRHDESLDGQIASFALIRDIDEERIDQALIVGRD
jgi:hypothetical protein